MALRGVPVVGDRLSLLRFADVHVVRGGEAVLRGVSLQVEAGETLVLLGRSGSGKTTLLKLANALLLPAKGRVETLGQDTRAADLTMLRRRIGYIIQQVGLFPHWTVSRNVALVPLLNGESAASSRDRARLLLEQVGLPWREFHERLPHELSGGQQQRVGIARALAAEPPLLLCDEPFGALDPVTRLELQRLFLRLREERGQTALFVTHDVREAMHLATRVAVLHEGTLEMSGSPTEFTAAQTPMARAFGDVLRAGA